MKQKDSRQYEVDEKLLEKLEQPFQKKKTKNLKRVRKKAQEKEVTRTYVIDEELQAKLKNPFEKPDVSFVHQLEEENRRSFHLTSSMVDELYHQVNYVFDAVFMIQDEEELDKYKEDFTLSFYERFKEKLKVRKRPNINSSMIFEKRVINYEKNDVKEQVEVRVQLIQAFEKAEKFKFFNHEVANTITYKMIFEKQKNWKLDKLKKVNDSKLKYRET